MSAPDFFAELEEGIPDFFADLDFEGFNKPREVQSKNMTEEQAAPDFISQIEPEKPDFFAELEEEKEPSKTPYDMPDLTPELLKSMSVSERRDYAKGLETEREYRQSKGLIKGSISGATFGLSEKIPGLKPEEGDLLTGLGEFAGSTLPISKLYNYLGKPLITLASKSPILSKGLQSLARMTGFGLTGAAYAAGKEKVKTGEFPSAKELAKHGAQWALFDGALQIVGKAASPFLPELKQVAQSRNLPERQVLNEVLDNLAERKIDIEKEPEKAIQAAQEILKSYAPEKMNLTVAPQTFRTSKIQSIAEPKIKQPIIETTGEGAAERIEQPKTGLDKILAKMNSFIQEAKTPIESLKRRGESVNTGIFNSLAPLEKMEADISVPEKVSTRIKLAQSAASEINSVLENGIYSNLTGNFEHGGLKEAYGDLTWKRLTKGLKEHEYSLEELDAYRVSKASLKRQREGKKTGVDTAQAQTDINRLAKKYEPIDRRIRDFQKATLETYGEDLLGKDLIEQWNKEYYAPLFSV